MECQGEDEAENRLDEFAGGGGSHPFADEAGLQRALQAVRAAAVATLSTANDVRENSGSPQPGDQLGQYELLELAGAGGMGVVFRAKHLKLNKVVAVKVIAERRLRDPDSLARFEREMQLLARFDHPNVVGATDGGVCDGIPYLVMNYIDGINAGTLVRQLGAIEVSAACEITRQAALGIEQLHAHQLIHRDIKPANLLVGFDGRVRVIDFGVARAVGSIQHDPLTGTQQFVGTVSYMSPEQAEGRELSIATDLYSLGVTFCYLLTGKVPSRFIVSDSDPIDGLLHDRVPQKVLDIIRRLLAADPNQRLSSARTLTEQLRSLSSPERLAEIVKKVRTASQALDENLQNSCSTLNDQKRRFETTDVAAVHRTPAGSDPQNTRMEPGPLRKLIQNWTRMIIVTVLAAISLAVLTAVFRSAPNNDDRVIDLTPDSGQEVSGSTQPASDSSKSGLPVKGAGTALPPGRGRRDAEQEVAHWILERGGNILLYPTVRVHRVEELPAGEFTVLNIALPDAGIDDEGAARFAKLANVRSLDLSGNPVTSLSLNYLAEWKKLRWLYLGRTRIEDDAVEHLLPHGATLETLDLSHTQVTSAGVGRLNGFLKLRELLIADTRTTDEGLVGLKRFPSLMRLNMSDTQFTDAGVEVLKECPTLAYLILDGTNVTDQAVPGLLQLNALRQLSLKNTGISTGGLRQLLDGLPDCEILN